MPGNAVERHHAEEEGAQIHYLTAPVEMLDRNGHAADVAPGSGHVMRIPVPNGVTSGAIDEFTMLVRYLPREPAQEKIA